MLTVEEKADVLANVGIELIVMFGKLENLYSRPGFEKGLPELHKIETYLKAKLLEYDPLYATIFEPDAADPDAA